MKVSYLKASFESCPPVTLPLLLSDVFIVFPLDSHGTSEDRDCAFISPVLSLVLAFNGCSVNIFRRKEAC